MATDAQSLLALSTCYACQTPGEWQLLKLGLLRQIVLGLNSMADTSPQALLDLTKCYQCYPPGLWGLLELGMLQMIAGGGLGGGVSYGTSDPTTAPPGNSGIYYRTDTGGLWVWNQATSTWDPFLV